MTLLAGAPLFVAPKPGFSGRPRLYGGGGGGGGVPPFLFAGFEPLAARGTPHYYLTDKNQLYLVFFFFLAQRTLPFAVPLQRVDLTNEKRFALKLEIAKGTGGNLTRASDPSHRYNRPPKTKHHPLPRLRGMCEEGVVRTSPTVKGY